MTPKRTPRRSSKRRTPKRTPQRSIPATGSRKQVMNGHAKHTSGGLTKNDLTYNKWGAIVSKKVQQQAKKRWPCIKDVFEENKAKPFSSKKSSSRSYLF